jgi:hypothetical protein
MSAQYVELAVWFSVYHYLAVNIAWYMPRDGLSPQPATKFPGSLVGSFATLPAATDTFLREYMLASALGEVVAALGRVRPTIWILRSLASDTQDETSTVSLLASFEAASFLGVAVGFVRCAFFDRNLHPRMPLVPIPAGLKRLHAFDQ